MDHGNDLRFDRGEQMPERFRRQTSRLLGMTAAQASRVAQSAFASVGAHRWHYGVLAALDESGPGSQSQIADRTGIYRSDLVATLNELVEGGHIERSPDPSDKRRNIITMTETGRARLAELDRVTAGINEHILAPLDEAERERLFALLRRLNDHLSA
ncbi:MarR family winged helix-turn-helix transcriptional regulator [Glycomyces arizonensis]|uniref:MarR family winged helix-turn-helix transcriptional regulator n=1 Tax=Glycomyces arizonensis TaxID=256035 RepID=UPI0004292399|nr:MarR family winged helix-turn-helix transcriptional regulator [Glycomyces arizonensis]